MALSEYSRRWNLFGSAFGLFGMMQLLGCLALVAVAQDADPGPKYLDTQLSFEERAKDLLSRMTLEEKASLLNHRGSYIERFDINANDQWNQCLHGVQWNRPTTMFPVSIAMGATWDPELVHQCALAISDEARAINNMWLDDPNYRAQRKGLFYRAPVINIERNPYWGRNEEAYSEDPHLTGRMGVAYVTGLQGDHPKYLKLVSTLKHYAVNNVERGRFSLSADVSERMLHEYWLPHFRDCIVEAKAQSVMASYNAINGTPNNINHLMLTEILKDRWGFTGFVVSDLGGVNTMVQQHTGGEMTYVDAVAQSLIAGCDYSDREFEQNIPEAVNEGKLPEDRLDDAVYRVLWNKFRLGQFDPAEEVPYRQIPSDVICSDEHRALALEAAQKAMVLLKNDGSLLPLDRDVVTSIAVIGPHADQFTSGNYSGQADDPVTPLEGIRSHVGAAIEVAFARGTGITDRVPTLVDRENGFSGGRSVKLDTQSEGDYLEFPIEVKQPGTYKISLRYKSFASRGIHQLSIDGENQGEPVDMYDSNGDYDNVAKLGNVEFDEPGRKTIRFTVVGRNPRSSSSTGHFDQITLSGPEEISREIERLEFRAGRPSSADQLADAAELAGNSDVAVVFVGTSNSIEAEGRDRTTLELPGRQEELIQVVYEANPKTVVVLMHAGPLAMPRTKENVPAIIDAWWHGVEGANAVADVIFGDVNPGGRLPHTVYVSDEQVPSVDEYDISKGFTYMYLDERPLYAFGHGLSYASFEYSNLELSTSQINADGAVTVKVDVKNTGDRPGDEVVQMYVRDVESSVVQPKKELLGFKRITLEPGETQTVELALRGDQLAFWDEVERHDFVVEPGEFEVLIGSASDNIHAAKTFQVTGSN